MKNSYFIERLNDGKWEEVDEYIWNNSHNVIEPNGALRYGMNRFAVLDGVVVLRMSIPITQLGIIARVAGATIPTGSVNGGLVQLPEGLLRVKNNRGFHFYDCHSGKKFKEVA